jgi:hypothetical protein
MTRAVRPLYSSSPQTLDFGSMTVNNTNRDGYFRIARSRLPPSDVRSVNTTKVTSSSLFILIRYQLIHIRFDQRWGMQSLDLHLLVDRHAALLPKLNLDQEGCSTILRLEGQATSGAPETFVEKCLEWLDSAASKLPLPLHQSLSVAAQ